MSTLFRAPFLDPTWLQKTLQETCVTTDFVLEVLPTTDSTNRYLLEKDTHNLHVCLAEQQTAGRGRLGKTWVSPYGTNLYCSIAWSFKQPILTLSGLSLCVGITVAKTLEDYGISSIELKWPNDVLYQRKKIAGILIETTPCKKNTYKAVIGIGLNVFLSKVLDQKDPTIDQPWTDVASAVNFKADRNQIAYRLLHNLFHMLPLFASQGFSAFQEVWLSRDILLNQPVTLQIAEKKLEGIGKGVDTMGRLLLEDAEGKIQCFHSAEVSRFRGVHGCY